MSAPQIPNLLSLRGRGGGGLRGRGGAGAGGGRSRGGFASPAASHDATIQGTDTDASVSRLSAVDLGYLQDPFAQYFVQNGPPVRRLPIINRGETTTNEMPYRQINGNTEYILQVHIPGPRPWTD